MIEKAIRDYILSDPELSTLLGGKRIYPHRVKDEFPAISYSFDDGANAATAGGLSKLRPWNIHLNTYCKEYDQLREVEKRVFKLLHGKSVTIGTKKLSGSFCRIIAREQEEDTHLHKSIIQIRIHERDL